MYMIAEVSQYVAVASFAEAWIEIVWVALSPFFDKSPPSRRRGLKYTILGTSSWLRVASFAEAWIEIIKSAIARYSFASPPSRRRGLKSFWKAKHLFRQVVASFAEAWIEIKEDYIS